MQQLSEKGAYLVLASSDCCNTSFVCYEDGTAYFLSDWQSGYPTSEDDIRYYIDFLDKGEEYEKDEWTLEEALIEAEKRMEQE